LTCNGSNGTTNVYTGPISVGGTASGGDFNLQGQAGTVTDANTMPGEGGATFFSLGANGVTYGVGAGVGNIGNPGTLKITWYA
jgi:hypothetical protein